MCTLRVQYHENLGESYEFIATDRQEVDAASEEALGAWTLMGSKQYLKAANGLKASVLKEN